MFAVAAACWMAGAQAAHSAGEAKKAAQTEKKESPVKPEKAEAKVSAKEEMAVIATKHGKIKIKFFPDVAPKHVESMKKLIRQKFYDGTTFHRVIPGFMIQGGDPNSKDPTKRQQHGTGGPGYTVPAEFNAHSHKRGILSMARSADPNSAGSQFFICVGDSTFLDGQYTAFGEVVEGMDVADKVVAEARDRNDNPLSPMTMTITLE
jgi:cyclophilin family peptidyl-prolyl cis-trans isomerase